MTSMWTLPPTWNQRTGTARSSSSHASSSFFLLLDALLFEVAELEELLLDEDDEVDDDGATFFAFTFFFFSPQVGRGEAITCNASGLGSSDLLLSLLRSPNFASTSSD